MAADSTRGRTGTDRFVEFDFSTDSSVGKYPQAEFVGSTEYLEDDGGLYYDRFPKLNEPSIKLKLDANAKRTDVLSSSLRAEGLLLNSKALHVFEKFDLGRHQRYAAEIQCSRSKTESYEYVFFANHLGFGDIDFDGSEFYIEDRLGRPVRPISVDSAKDLEEKKQLAVRGKLEGCQRFFRVNPKRIAVLDGHLPEADVFGLRNLTQSRFVSAPLHEALIRANITGITFSENQSILVAGS